MVSQGFDNSLFRGSTNHRTTSKNDAMTVQLSPIPSTITRAMYIEPTDMSVLMTSPPTAKAITRKMHACTVHMGTQYGEPPGGFASPYSVVLTEAFKTWR